MRLAKSGTPFKRVRDSLEIEYTFGGHLVRLSLSRRSCLDRTETVMPTEHEAMEMLLRHFPNAELVEHLPILQALINALFSNASQYQEGICSEVKEYRIPMRLNQMAKVIGKRDSNNDFIVFSYEIVEGRI